MAKIKKNTSKSSLPVRLSKVKPSGSPEDSFFEQVMQVARQIPRGRVTSYGAIAASLGAKSSSRLVGWAMHGAHSIKPPVPAHRVVNRNGMLTGKHHFATEGVKVKDDKVIDFKKLFWNPSDEL
jgi:methylated-DNA-protein-cysteine methyltransferase-like protein